MMKAYKAWDREGYGPYATVVFAETAGKARAIAANCDGLEDFSFTGISVRRCAELDPYYRGGPEMDWDDMSDRIAMVRYAGFSCSYELSSEELDCSKCGAFQWCERGERWRERWMSMSKNQSS